MRKVSRSMLATIAALQSGGHSRRKVKYLREQALVSLVYPSSISDTSSLTASIEGINKSEHSIKDASIFGVSFSGSVKSSRVDFQGPADCYSVGFDFDIEIEHSKTRRVSYGGGVDYFGVNVDFDIEIDKHSISRVGKIAGPDYFVVGLNFSVDITLIRG